MAVDFLQNWELELEKLPKVKDSSWASNFSSWSSDRISSLAQDSVGIFPNPSFTPTGWIFTFNKSVFSSELVKLKPTTNALEGITAFASAWESAVLLSSVAVLPGSFIGTSTPATLFSLVATTIIDIPSVAIGKAKIIELASIPPNVKSKFPEKFRQAFLSLTVTVTGTNSLSPTPAPLTAPNISLV